MAICNNCGSETSRVRTTFAPNGALKDECPRCAPESFERFKSVRDGQISCAWEYDHKRYKLVDGLPQITDEGLQDLEDAASKQSEDANIAYQKAVEEKRHNRRTNPMTQAEIEIACNRYLNESRESLAAS